MKKFTVRCEGVVVWAGGPPDMAWLLAQMFPRPLEVTWEEREPA